LFLFREGWDYKGGNQSSGGISGLRESTLPRLVSISTADAHTFDALTITP
jgi:hypothetical protein